MPELTDQSELDAYYLADPAHERAAGVMWPAIIERRIDKLFETALRPETAIRNELFRPSGALGNYAVKVRLAYLLGWIGRDIYDDLLTIAKIRNRFAHTIEATTFSDQKIGVWLRNLNSYQIIPGMIERFKERAHRDPTPRNKTAAFVASGIVEADISAFRFCVDQMLHHLEKCRANMEKNLAGLPGNWLVAELKSD